MLHDLDDTLQELLAQEQSLVRRENIGFNAPHEPPKATLAFNLFLYDVRENRELRSNEWTVERTSSEMSQKMPPPVRVDCSYLITAWADDGKEEHKLLGELMKVLLRHRRIPDWALKGSLKGREPPLRTVPLQPMQLQSLGEFWQALGNKPKAAFNYTVTISVDLELPHERVEIPLVTDSTIEIYPGTGKHGKLGKR